jgi:hypothetical protein
MKSRKSIFINSLSLVCVLTIASCGGKKENEMPLYQSYELQGTDTINKVDTAGLKQGPWFFYADKGKKANKDVKPKLLVKGTYVDDKREGTWLYFNIDGTPSDTVVYRNDFPQDK